MNKPQKKQMITFYPLHKDHRRATCSVFFTLTRLSANITRNVVSRQSNSNPALGTLLAISTPLKIINIQTH